MQLKVLLIEDTRSHAVRFINKIQEEIGRDIQVEWRISLNAALQYLRSNEVDQIWLDACLPDIEDKEIPGALEALKRYVEPGEVRVLTEDTPEAEFRRKTRLSSQYDVVDKAQMPQMLEAIQQLLAKRSNSTSATTKVELARLEGQIIHLQYQQTEDRDRVNSLEQRLTRCEQQLSEFSIQLRLVSDQLKVLPDLQKSISTLLSLDEKEKRRNSTFTEIMKVLIPAVIGGAIAILTIFINAHIQKPQDRTPAPILTR